MSEAADMSLGMFKPETFILINDILTGVRKMGMVQSNGLSYVDLTVSEMWGGPWPIYNACAPEDIGRLQDWMQRARDQGCYDGLCDLAGWLMSNEIDYLTMARTLYWALENREFSPSLALSAGQALTAQVIESREINTRLVLKSGLAVDTPAQHSEVGGK